MMPEKLSTSVPCEYEYMLFRSLRVLHIAYCIGTIIAACSPEAIYCCVIESSM